MALNFSQSSGLNPVKCGWAWAADERDFGGENHRCSEVMLTQIMIDNRKVPRRAGTVQRADFGPHNTVLLNVML